MTEMTDIPRDESPGTRPAEFAEEVKQLLEHLYDLPFMQAHPLAAHPRVRLVTGGETPSQSLRRVLIEAIEALKMPREQAATPPGRHYNVVYLHYVDGMTIQEAAHQLGVSLRQAYRDLQRGVDGAASFLWEHLMLNPAAEAGATASDSLSVRSEVERLTPRLAKIDLAALIAYAERAVQRLALQRGVALEISLPEAGMFVQADDVVAQQALVRVFSHVVQHTRSSRVQVRLAHESRTALISVACLASAADADAAMSDALSQHLFERLGWSVQFGAEASGAYALHISIPTDLRMLLVIDDNEAIVELLDRYLTNLPYRLLAATSGAEGLRLARDLLPDVIMLDIMMPEMDGWELLQRLRNHPRTARIPIIVCSVFNDPELAFSLGATFFLPKPLDREEFLDMLLRAQA